MRNVFGIYIISYTWASIDLATVAKVVGVATESFNSRGLGVNGGSGVSVMVLIVLWILGKLADVVMILGTVVGIPVPTLYRVVRILVSTEPWPACAVANAPGATAGWEYGCVHPAPKRPPKKGNHPYVHAVLDVRAGATACVRVSAGATAALASGLHCE